MYNYYHPKDFSYKNTRLYQSSMHLEQPQSLTPHYNQNKFSMNFRSKENFYRNPFMSKAPKYKWLEQVTISKPKNSGFVYLECFDERKLTESCTNDLQLKTKKPSLVSLCSIGENLCSLKADKPEKFEFSFKSLASENEEANQNFQKIGEVLNNSCRLKNSLDFKCNLSRNNDMILAYEDFHKTQKQHLAHAIKDFEILRSKSNFSILILKFLLDMLSKKDFENLRFKESYLIQNFFVNRYFRGIKTKIFQTIEKLEEFKNLKQQWNCLNSKGPQKINEKVSIIEEMSYSFAINLWYSSSHVSDRWKIFDVYYLESFCKESGQDLRNLFRETCVKIHRLVCFLILKIIVTRFKQTQVVYDDIECLEDDICKIIKFLLQNFLLFKSNDTKVQRCREKMREIFEKLNEMFECGKSEDLFLMSKYIKMREMREYLGRKKKSKFVRPRRNDEKLKKIYKNLLRSMQENFKQTQIQNQCFETHHTTQESENNSWYSENTENYLKNASCMRPRKDILQNKKLKNNNKLGKFLAMELQKNFQKSANHGNDKLKKNFYDFYFKAASLRLNLPLEYFYDPLKKIYTNTGFKSFTTKYFKLLLQSNIFKADVTRLFDNDQFILEAFMEYPKTFEQILNSVPTIFIDQQMKKSKFLWTSYELFFASYYFRSKMNF